MPKSAETLNFRPEGVEQPEDHSEEQTGSSRKREVEKRALEEIEGWFILMNMSEEGREDSGKEFSKKLKEISSKSLRESLRENFDIKFDLSEEDRKKLAGGFSVMGHFGYREPETYGEYVEDGYVLRFPDGKLATLSCSDFDEMGKLPTLELIPLSDDFNFSNPCISRDHANSEDWTFWFWQNEPVSYPRSLPES